MSATVLFYFDYVDPISYLVELQLQELERAGGPAVRRMPFELRPPPVPLADPGDPGWRERWRAARATGEVGARLVETPLVPWTRKAHELVLHARDSGRSPEVHRALFHAVFERGLDVGRVDVLVRLAAEQGLDVTAAKAVLDVDRFSGDVIRLRDEGVAAGIHDVPVLARSSRRLQGFHNVERIRTFLDR